MTHHITVFTFVFYGFCFTFGVKSHIDKFCVLYNVPNGLKAFLFTKYLIYYKLININNKLLNRSQNKVYKNNVFELKTFSINDFRNQIKIIIKIKINNYYSKKLFYLQNLIYLNFNCHKFIRFCKTKLTSQSYSTDQKNAPLFKIFFKLLFH